MQFQIRDKLIQQHCPVLLVGFQCFLALVAQKVIFPFFIVQIIGMVLFDMLHKGTVPVAQVLPPLVVVENRIPGKVIPTFFEQKPVVIHFSGNGRDNQKVGITTKVFLITYNAGNTNFAKFPQKKNAAIEKITTLLSLYSILAGQ